MQDAAVLHRHPRQLRAAALERAAQALIAAVREDAVKERGGDQRGMAGLAVDGGAGEGRVGLQQRAHRGRRKERDIHRREEQAVAFVAQIAQTDADRVEHLRRPVVFVAQEDDAVAAQMPLEQRRVVARDHDDLLLARLLEGRDHALGDGDGADVQHGLEVSHSGGHARRHDQSGVRHVSASFLRTGKKGQLRPMHSRFSFI